LKVWNISRVWNNFDRFGLRQFETESDSLRNVRTKLRVYCHLDVSVGDGLSHYFTVTRLGVACPILHESGWHAARFEMRDTETAEAVEALFQRELRNDGEQPALTERPPAAQSNDELRSEWKERIYYGEADEDYAMWAQQQQDQGIGVVGAGVRSHGHGLSRLRKASKEIAVRHSIKAEGSGIFSFIVTISGLLEREVMPLLRFQEEQRKNATPKAAKPSQSPKQTTISNFKTLKLSKSKKSPAGKVFLEELPPDVQEKVLGQIDAIEQAEGRIHEHGL
jgi:hypothetical protein